VYPDETLLKHGINSGSIKVKGSQISLTIAGKDFLKKMRVYYERLSKGIPIEKRTWRCSNEKIQTWPKWWEHHKWDKTLPDFTCTDSAFLVGGRVISAISLPANRYTKCSKERIDYILNLVDKVCDNILTDVEVIPFAYQRVANPKRDLGVVWFQDIQYEQRYSMAEEYYDLILYLWGRANGIFVCQFDNKVVFYSYEKPDLERSLCFRNKINMICGAMHTLPENGWPRLEVE